MIDDTLEPATTGKIYPADQAPRSRREAPRDRLSPRAIHELLRADSREEIFRHLASIAVAEVGADGAAIVEVLADGDGRVTEVRGAPAALGAWHGEVDAVDAELGERLLAVTDGHFGHARALPLACSGSVFGALVLFFKEIAPGGGALRMAQALVDIAATELDKVRQHAELRRSNAELRASREVLERTERLRALGEMSAGISHDLLNILNPLSLHLQLLRRILDRSSADVPGARDAVEEMGHVVKRGVETVARLRDFGRQAPETPIEVVSLDAMVHEAVELTHPRIASRRRSHGIRIVTESGAPPPVPARSSELMGALLNLLVNAVDAMEEGGTITVRTGTADGGAWVEVADDGPGIPIELQHRIFEPFFTTKGTAGTGLGLAMVYACVKRYSGKLSLDSAPGRGTRFNLWFPCSAIDASASPGSVRVPFAPRAEPRLHQDGDP